MSGVEDSLQVDELAVVHFEQHTGDLAGQLGLHLVDLGVERLTEHLLLLANRGSVEDVQVDATSTGEASLRTLAWAAVRTTAASLREALATAHGRSHLTLGHAGHARDGALAATATTTHGLLSLSRELHVLGGHVRSREATGGHARGHVHRRDLLGVGTATATLLRHTAGEATSTLLSRNASGEGHLTTAARRKHHGLARSKHLRHATELLLLLLLHAELIAGLDGGLELVLTDILALGKSDVEGLAVEHALVHVGDSLGGLIGVAEANETETLALAEDLLLALDGDLVASLGGVILLLIRRLLLLLLLLGVLLLLSLLLLLLLGLGLLLLRVGVGLSTLGRDSIAHDLGGSDGTERSEHLAKLLVIDLVTEVLDVEVDTLVLRLLLKTGSLVLLAELFLTLVLLLGTANVELLTLEVSVVQGVDGGSGSLVLDVVDETETTALALVVPRDRRGGDISVLLEELAELVVSNVKVDVLDVDVGEVGLHLLELAHALLLGDV